MSGKESFRENLNNLKFLPPLLKNQILFYGTTKHYVVLRFFMTIYERIKLARNIVSKKLRADIKSLREEQGYDVTKLEENFDDIEKYRFK